MSRFGIKEDFDAIYFGYAGVIFFVLLVCLIIAGIVIAILGV